MAELEPPGPGKIPWVAPRPLGYGPADAVALFIAAPLLTAAALSLAGVVGGADTHFRWPGPILLLLVISALALIASIQLSYHARLYLYSYDDLVNWYSEEYVKDHRLPLYNRQKDDFEDWEKYNFAAVVCFNAGTLLLGLGIAAALVPPDGGVQAPWRWTAAVVVLLATVVDGIWITVLHRKVARYPFDVLVRRAIGRRS
ncbi:hypothetical protein [Streptomyces sp. HGB0020]|uniref:hypothetical protein n=1 Tax=Streptomyces sp. HGB0020 TaxID=1078086 RepID=UPI00034E714B|nr:hypothetical protein [Streptomyces sp. HGB0020]EPD60848.1 hypothetical protein HMPREF1211_04866 [Streptomyces sp. HGB0020]